MWDRLTLTITNYKDVYMTDNRRIEIKINGEWREVTYFATGELTYDNWVTPYGFEDIQAIRIVGEEEEPEEIEKLFLLANNHFKSEVINKIDQLIDAVNKINKKGEK